MKLVGLVFAYLGTICTPCGRWSVLCDLDPMPCPGCDCPDDWRRYVIP